MGIYEFYAYPESTRHRVSQFLILPHFQKQGHAVQFLLAVRQRCIDSQDCVEVVMEDPTPSFYCIRILAELVHFVQMKIWQDVAQLPALKNDDKTFGLKNGDKQFEEIGKKLCVN